MPTPPPLSDRHLDLLRLEAQGLTLAEAARELQISRHTVRSHWRIIFARFEPVLSRLGRQRSRINVVLVALILGILTVHDLSTSGKDAPDNANLPPNAV